MKLQDILTLDCTLCAVPVSSKKRIFDTLCSLAESQLPEQTKHDLLDSLMTRERLGSTGIGNGIAIPHGRISSSDTPVAVLMTTEQAVPFDAIDNRPVDIFIALFVPENCCQDHLDTLQSIARLFADKQFTKAVRKCQTSKQLFEVIQQAD